MAKGGAFERSISKKISLWWTDGERDDIFWRTAGSGGRATVRRKQGKATANAEGDICAIDPIGQPLIDLVAIELKKGYNSWNIKSLLDTNQKEPQLLQFISQCEREREGKGCKGWWLITGQDRRKVLLFFNHAFWRRAKKKCGKMNFLDRIVIYSGDIAVHCVVFDDFIENIKKTDLF